MTSTGNRPQATYCSLLAAMAAAGALALGLGTYAERTGTVRAWTEPVHLTILHTNDMHGQALETRDGSGGLVALGRAIRQERDAARRGGREVLLLDAGDFFQGTVEGNLTDGRIMVAWMNHLGYDALAVGNHEFDFGLQVPQALAREAEFPFLGANIVDAQTRRRPAWLGSGRGAEVAAVLRRTYRAGGRVVRVGVIGVTTSEMKDVTVAGATDGLAFLDEADTVERVLAAEAADLDVVVLLTHCGLETDRELARRFSGRVDVIIGGHSHSRLPRGEVVDGVLVAQAHDKTKVLGRVDLTIRPPDPQGPRDARPRVAATATLIPAGDDLEALLDPYLAQVAEQRERPVGTLTGPLRKVSGYASSALGNLQTDLMRELTRADVALHNKTGIRANLEAGEVRWGDVFAVSPFGNTVEKLVLEGRDLRDLVEGMLAGTHKLLEVSGAVVICDPQAPEGQRLIDLLVDGAPVDPDETYLVATNNFLAGGGDGHEAFTRALERTDTGFLMRDLLVEFLQQRSPYTPAAQPEARIVVQAR